MFPDEIQELEDLGSRVVCDKGDKQLRVAVSDFRGVLYLSFRWWNLNFEQDGYYPTKEGITLPYNLDVVSKLWDSMVDLLSESEVIDKLLEHGVKIEKYQIPTKTE